MTTKQKIFKDFILKRLGFMEGSYTNEYLKYLSEIVYLYKGIVAEYSENPDADFPYHYYDLEHKHFFPSEFSLLDLLFFEYQSKRKKSFKKIELASKYLSATDLANFTFCPVAFSIGKSFETPKNILANNGSTLHSKHHLLNLQYEYIFDDDFLIELFGYVPEEEKVSPAKFITAENKYFFDEIRSSELIFSGHLNDESKERERYFFNRNKGFIGQPDYIFKNYENEYFIVEEKFRKKSDFASAYFFDNHKVQLASYIYYMNTYEIKYGYLIYWNYEIRSDELDLMKCEVLKIDRNTKIEQFLDNKFSSISSFICEKKMPINENKLNPKKCANCVYMILCGHKNKRHNVVSFPYSESYFNLFNSDYPDQLKKD